jgi:hypothetical protein
MLYAQKVIQASLSVFLIVSSSVACALGGRPPREVKIYILYPDNSFCDPVEPWCQDKVGLVRKQSKEVKSFEDSKEYICMSNSDFVKIVQSCPRE